MRRAEDLMLEIAEKIMIALKDAPLEQNESIARVGRDRIVSAAECTLEVTRRKVVRKPREVLVHGWGLKRMT